MRRLLLLLALVGACARPTLPVADPAPVGPDTMVELQVPVEVYRLAGRVFETLGEFTAATGQETAACITRWNSRWKGDTLVAIEVYTAVPLPALYADDTTFVPLPAVGACWWRFPSVHWHTLHSSASGNDYYMAVRSMAPFHLLIYKDTVTVYGLRLATLRKDNPR